MCFGALQNRLGFNRKSLDLISSLHCQSLDTKIIVMPKLCGDKYRFLLKSFKSNSVDLGLFESQPCALNEVKMRLVKAYSYLFFLCVKKVDKSRTEEYLIYFFT